MFLHDGHGPSTGVSAFHPKTCCVMHGKVGMTFLVFLHTLLESMEHNETDKRPRRAQERYAQQGRLQGGLQSYMAGLQGYRAGLQVRGDTLKIDILVWPPVVALV